MIARSIEIYEIEDDKATRPYYHFRRITGEDWEKKSHILSKQGE